MDPVEPFEGPAARRELAALLRLGTPLVIAQLAAMGMHVVDTLLAGRHGALALAAVGVGSAVWSLVMLASLGLLMALPPIVSRHFGAGDVDRIGPISRQGLWLAWVVGSALGLAVWVGAEPLLVAIGIASDVRPQAVEFLSGLAPGAPAFALFCALRYISEGVGRSMPTMIIGLLGLALLIPLGWLLLEGSSVTPAFGVYGLGIATSILLWLECVAYGWLLARGRGYRQLAVFGSFDRPDPAMLAELVRLGAPIGFAILMEGGMFVASALAVGTLGATQIAAHQVAINLASIAFMVPLGIAMAATVRVGVGLGAGSAHATQAALRAALWLTVLTQTASGLILAFGGARLAGLYTTDAAVVTIAASLLAIAALFQFADGIQAVTNGCLRGFKDTRVPMLITAAAYWGIGMPIGLAACFVWGYGARGIWFGLLAGLTAAAVGLGWRLAGQKRGLIGPGGLSTIGPNRLARSADPAAQ